MDLRTVSVGTPCERETIDDRHVLERIATVLEVPVVMVLSEGRAPGGGRSRQEAEQPLMQTWIGCLADQKGEGDRG